MFDHSALEESIFRPGKPEHAHYPDASCVARGKAARKTVPRSAHAELALHGRPDPVDLLEEQGRTRVADLVAIRYGRMLVSPFTFFRGAALIMASDLAHTPSSGLRTQVCGDAHLMNYGMFGTPDRRLIFDVNDFDETLPGPWEWDIKRLATSLEIAGRNNGYSKRQRRDIVADCVRCYHETMVELATMGNLEVWYAHLDVEAALDEFANTLTRQERKQAGKAADKAFHEDSSRALHKLTEPFHGDRRIVSAPPLLVPMRELTGSEEAQLAASATRLFEEYADSLVDNARVLFGQYRLVELARKVVGVGSVGTRCWIALFLGIDNDDPLFLQVKEADASVLERFAGRSTHADHAQRVVAGQRLMQAASDVLLGWAPQITCFDGKRRDFYVRQLRDWKGSFDLERAQPRGMSLYGRMCSWALARAHARSGDRVAIASYLGTKDRFEEALATFAAAYADQNERDYESLARAARSGRIRAELIAA